MIRLVAGALIMVAALALQLAMVVRVLEPSLLLGLGGYAALFAGMIVALLGVLGRRRN